jgi:two-component system, NarL family, response regulator
MLLDLRMPNLDGIDTLRALRKLPSAPKVVILSNFEFDEEIYRAVEAGAMGYLLKDTSRDEIINAVKAVHAGDTYFPGRIEARLLERKQRHDLSAREVEILELLAKGLTNKAIGQALGISAFTVRNHVNRILEKLQVCDRTEASTVAIEQGILLMHHS